MKLKGIIAVTALMMMNLPNFAQEPLPEDIMKKISYGTGMNIARQLSQNPNLKLEVMVQGFQDAVAQKLDTDKIAYAEGAGIATQVGRSGMMPDEVLRAIQDAEAGNPPPYTEEEMIAANEEAQRFMQERQQMQQQQVQKAQLAAAGNLEMGQAFLAENAAKEGVMTTMTGLQYEVIEEGEGDNPEATDTVKVHYTGRLLDGTAFDSSVGGDPAEFPLGGGMIPGWIEGLQLMSPGAKYRFWIPANIAYGERAPPVIGPNQVLDFEVELIEIQ